MCAPQHALGPAAAGNSLGHIRRWHRIRDGPNSSHHGLAHVWQRPVGQNPPKSNRHFSKQGMNHDQIRQAEAPELHHV